jgi:hypothetical protein
MNTGQNLYYHPGVRRVVEIDPAAKQITLQDERYYRRQLGVYYPSVTYILSYLPKTKFFENWIKDVGHNIDIILRKAAEEGTATHTGIEALIKGEQLVWVEENGYVNYPTVVWRMLERFQQFWKEYKPELIATECHLFSDEYKYAGTVDLVCKINDQVWLLDVKTSNSLHRSYDLQTAAYVQAWNETHNLPIERRGILWLKSPKRGKGVKGKIQGEGWEIRESTKSLEADLQAFKLAYELFLLENEEGPSIETLPTSLRLDT